MPEPFNFNFNFNFNFTGPTIHPLPDLCVLCAFA